MNTTLQRYGRKHGPDSKPWTVERFMELVIPVPEAGCWLFTGAWNKPANHGMTSYVDDRGKKCSAHRVAWMLLRGKVADGMHVLHKCDTPPCVNPDHLYIGTHAQNMRDVRTRKRSGHLRKTHCPSGHPYSGDNLRTVEVSGGIGRLCITCRRAAQRKYNRRVGRKVITPDKSLVERINSAISTCGGLRAAARAIQISPTFLRNCLIGVNFASKNLLEKIEKFENRSIPNRPSSTSGST